MNDNLEFELLADLAKLLKKYGPEVFERLASQLHSPDFSERLASLLAQYAKVADSMPHGSRLPKETRTTTSKGIRSKLTALAQSEPEKSQLLLEFYDQLIAKSVLPTMRDLQLFASDIGLPPLKATARDKALTQLTQALMTIPAEKLKLTLRSIPTKSVNTDLDRWTNIILKTESRTKKQNKRSE